MKNCAQKESTSHITNGVTTQSPLPMVSNKIAPKNGHLLHHFFKDPRPFLQKADVVYYISKMPKNQRQKIVVIVGPTASGKSDLSIFLARKFGGEIISADSRQVYRSMDIGTGKVTKKEQRSIKHHLLDVANPKKTFTVSDFKKLSEKSVKKILDKNKIPFIVGGTGFYVDALIKDLALPEVPPDKKLRTKLEKRTAKSLYEKLKKLDGRRAKVVDPQNKRRLIRALEIIKATGKPVPPLKESPKYEVSYIGIKPPKDTLEKRIKLRLEKRLRQGMIKEVNNLLRSGVSRKRLYEFGLEYRQISEYLASEKFKVKSAKNFKKSEYYQKLLQEIVRYSKRQMTWFKRNKEICWLIPSKAEGVQKEAEKLIQDFFQFPRGV